MNGNKSFLRIPNKFFKSDKDGLTIFNKIGTKGFSLWTYLLMTQGNQPMAQTSIKRIKTFFYRFKDTTRKKQAKNGLSDARTIKKYMIALNKIGLIECEQLEKPKIQADGEQLKETKIRADDELFIKVNSCLESKEAHQQISAEFFIDKICVYGNIGWSIYCMLYTYHNTSFGNQMAGNFGFASCSEDYIANILNIKRQTISEYIHMFLAGDVKTELQPPITYYNAVTDKEEQKYMPSHYMVLAKVDSGNKYYCGKV